MYRVSVTLKSDLELALSNKSVETLKGVVMFEVTLETFG